MAPLFHQTSQILCLKCPRFSEFIVLCPLTSFTDSTHSGQVEVFLKPSNCVWVKQKKICFKRKKKQLTLSLICPNQTSPGKVQSHLGNYACFCSQQLLIKCFFLACPLEGSACRGHLMIFMLFFTFVTINKMFSSSLLCHISNFFHIF